MIKIKKVTSFPVEYLDQLAPYAKKEFAQLDRFSASFWSRVPKAWLITVNGKPLFLAGVFQTSWLGSGIEFWYMSFQNIGEHGKLMLRFLRRALRLISRFYPAMKISVERSFETGRSFARALGFREVPSFSSIHNDSYIFYSFERR